MTARERREQERKILAEMDEAMSEKKALKEGDEMEQNEPTAKKKKQRKHDSTMPEQVHCKRCKTLMENGVCPACGFKIYVPMDEEKRKKIKLWMTVGAFAVFIVLFVILQYQKG